MSIPNLPEKGHPCAPLAARKFREATPITVPLSQDMYDCVLVELINNETLSTDTSTELLVDNTN